MVIPIAYRVPNPPVTFVGREGELRAIESSLQSNPLTLVLAPPGLGKSATIQQAFHSSFSKMRSSTVTVSLAGDDPLRQAQLDLAGVLSQITGSTMDVVEPDPILLTQLLIDWAERAGVWVVLEDAQDAIGPDLVELLSTIASYGRESRWIVSTRAAIRGPRLGNHVELGPMSAGELLELGQVLRPDLAPPEVLRAVAAADGSPMLLIRFLELGVAAFISSREQLTQGLAQTSTRFVAELACVGLPLPRKAFEDLPDPETLASLERRGLIVSGPAGYRAHDSVASLFVRELSEEDRVTVFASKAGALERLGESHAVSAVRCWLGAGELGRAERVLERSCDRLIQLGQAPRLWAAIRWVRDPRLSVYQTKCAAEMGNPTALGQIPDASEASLPWAEAQFARGDVHGARATCQTLVDAGLLAASELLARCVFQLEDAEAALQALSSAPSTHEADALRLHLRACLQEGDLETDLVRLRSQGTTRSLLDVAYAEHSLGRSEEALSTIERVQLTPRGDAELLVGRMALVLKARILAERGDARGVADLLDAVEPFARDGSMVQMYYAEVVGLHALLTGSTERLRRVEQASKVVDAIDVHLSRRLARIQESLAVQHGSARVTHRTEARRGRGRELRGLARAERCVVEGDFSAAIELARAALDEARREGSTADYLDSAELLVDAHFLRAQGSLPALNRLDGLRADSVRARSFLDLHRNFQQPAVLEACASLPSGTATRRARALLGGSPSLDDVDVAVVAAMRAASRIQVETLHGKQEEWGSGWGVDERKREVWLPSGTVVSLARKPLLLRLVSHLVREGRATKEELIRSVWEERAYHPGRHDPRVHMTIRKLRETIEDNPSRPVRILTLESGYSVGGAVRWASPT